MRFQAFEDLQPVERAREGFRSGGIRFHDLMAGEEGTASNYGLQLVHVEDAFGTPRHRHNFEQVRVLLDGEFGFGPGQVQRKGSVGYFCEGTYYTQDAKGPSTTLLLQIGGPSGQGFMSRWQLLQGIEELAARGKFEGGVFTWFDDAGKKHNQDSYEAVWEHVHGKPVRYPQPQYAGPVLLEPERFDWLPAAPGVRRRDLGSFNGRGLALAEWSLDARATFEAPADARARLAVCLAGEGSAGGHAWRRFSCIEWQPGEPARIEARTDSRFFVFLLPHLDS